MDENRIEITKENTKKTDLFDEVFNNDNTNEKGIYAETNKTSENKAKNENKELLKDAIKKENSPEEKKIITETVKETNQIKTSETLEQVKTNNKQNKETTNEVKPKLKLLEDKKSNTAFIGRKKSLYDKYGSEAGLFVGKVKENTLHGEKVLLDSLNPHVVFICGSRGSGKSYAIGVIAEELAKKNKNVAAVVIDPIGVFWSMRFPNKEEKEIEKLAKWNLKPEGLDNLVVFIPKGLKKETPRGTYDATFAIKPSMLTTHDWSLTFGIERFSPSGLLLDRVLNKVKTGFKDLKGNSYKGKKVDYSIEDIVYCLENDSELNSRERGFKTDSIRALSSRFEAAKSWGIFDVKGTPLVEVCREGRLTVIDTSFLDDNVTALVVGILSRRILAARKLSTRKEAASQFEKLDAQNILETDIPPTWLFIDEAHTLIPSGNVSTAATNALVEYVKQGRRPGCSLVFATQQPSAIDTKVLSQLDIIMTHKLVFNDDIKAVFKRTPTIMPHKYKVANFIKTLPVGTAVLGDRREETSRAFVMEIRPRMSQHEGREAETTEIKKTLSNEQVLLLAVTMLWYKLERERKLSFETIKKELKELNEKYLSHAKFDKLLAKLEVKGALIKEEEKIVLLEEEIEEKQEEKPEEEIKDEVSRVEIKPVETEEKPEEELKETVSLVYFKPRYTKKNALKLLNKFREKKFLGLIGNQELLDSFELKAMPVYKIDFNYFNEKNSFRQGSLYVDSLTGEFLHYVKNKLIESKGLNKLYGLKQEQIKIIEKLRKEALTKKQLQQIVMLNEAKIIRLVEELKKKKLVTITESHGERKINLIKKIELPLNPLHPLMKSLESIPVQESELLSIVAPKYNRKEVMDLLKSIWKKIVITKINEIYWPVFEAMFKKYNGKTRKILVDAVNGEKIYEEMKE